MANFLNADNFYYLNMQNKQKFQAKIAHYEIWDDPGMYFSLKLNSNYSMADKLITSTRVRPISQTTCTLEETKTIACHSYLIFDFMSSGRKTKIIRSYKGVVETISDLGGVNSVVFFVFLMINYAYCHYREKPLMVRAVFDFFKDDSVFPKSEKGCWNKSAIEKKRKELEGKAYKIIEKSLDIVTLVREINTLRVLTHMLLKDYHVKLAPLVALSLQCKRDDYLKKMSTKSRKSLNKQKMAEFADPDDESHGLSYDQALDIVKKNNQTIAAQRELEH